jgi:uncharacterized protein
MPGSPDFSARSARCGEERHNEIALRTQIAVRMHPPAVTAGTYAALALTVAAAAFVQGSAGMGFALITAPVAALVFPAFVPAGLLALMLPLNAYVAWRENHALDRSGAAWITAGRVVGTGAGAWLLAAIAPSRLSVLVGAATLLAVLATVVAPSFAPRRNAFLAAGLVTGITETATGVGGPPLALVYQHHGGPTLRSTLAVCFLVGEVISLALLAALGRVGAAPLGAALALAPALAVGVALSRGVHRRLDGRVLRAAVLVFAVASALVLIARA